jgi:hypothetical protein
VACSELPFILLQTPAYGNAALRSSPGAENNFSVRGRPLRFSLNCCANLRGAKDVTAEQAAIVPTEAPCSTRSCQPRRCGAAIRKIVVRDASDDYAQAQMRASS